MSDGWLPADTASSCGLLGDLGAVGPGRELAGPQTASCHADCRGVGGIADDRVEHAAVVDEFLGALCSRVYLEHLAAGGVERRHRGAQARRAVHRVADGHEAPLELCSGELDVDVHRLTNEVMEEAMQSLPEPDEFDEWQECDGRGDGNR